MRRLPAVLAAAAVLIAAPPILAQEEVPYTVVSEMELAPEDATAFVEQVTIVAKAAAEIGLDPRFNWNLYRWDNTFWFVGNESTLANLEDPEAMFREFGGTSVEADVMAAVAAVGGMNVLSAETEILRVNPDLSYQPDTPPFGEDGPQGVFIAEQWVKGDSREAFYESVSSFTEMLGEMGMPYPVLVAEDIVGDGNVSFVVIFDSIENFYGKNSMANLVTGSDLGARMAAGEAAHSKLISRVASQMMIRLPDASYQGGGN